MSASGLNVPEEPLRGGPSTGVQMAVGARRVHLASCVLVALALLGILTPSFLLSDNVHSLEESVAFDRIALAQRTFWADGAVPAGAGLPTTLVLDPNFPVGTAVWLGIPFVLGLDPVLFGRVTSAIFALLAAIGLGLTVGASSGRTAGLLAAAAIWGVPGFVRSASVCGGAAPYTAALLGSAAVLAWEARGARARRGPVMLAGALLGFAVLFRLDAFALAPVWIVAAGLVLGPRSAAVMATAASPAFLFHLQLTWRSYGHPFAFARSASKVTQDTMSGAGDFLPTALGRVLVQQLTMPVVLLAIVGTIAAIRSTDKPTRLLGLLSAGTAAAYVSMVGLGSMQPRLVRYLVPLLAVALGIGVTTLWSWTSGRTGRQLIAVLLATALLGLGGRAAIEEARFVRLPLAIKEAASYVKENHGDQTVWVSGYHPEFVILSGMPQTRVFLVPTLRRGGLDVSSLRLALAEAGGGVVVAFERDSVGDELPTEGPALGLDNLGGIGTTAIYGSRR